MGYPVENAQIPSHDEWEGVVLPRRASLQEDSRRDWREQEGEEAAAGEGCRRAAYLGFGKRIRRAAIVFPFLFDEGRDVV